MNTRNPDTRGDGPPLLAALILLAALLAVGCAGSKPAPGYQEACSGSAIFTIVLDGFKQDQASALSRDMEGYKCFGSLSVKRDAVNTSTHHEYVYSSGLGSAGLERALKKSLSNMGAKASVSSGGSTITLTRTQEPKVRSKADTQ